MGIFPVCPTIPMGHWDGMDSKDTGMRVGNFPSLSYSSHGTLGWDGQCRYESGTGWEVASLSYSSHGTLGLEYESGTGWVPSLSLDGQ